MERNEFILDTNILIEIIHGNKIVIDNVTKAGAENCHMSVISLYELYYGAYNASNKNIADRNLLG